MNTKKKYLIGIAVLFIAAILCMPVMGVSASPIKENPPKPSFIKYNPPKTSFIKYNPPKPSFIKFNQPPYKHPQPPVQGKRMGMPNPKTPIPINRPSENINPKIAIPIDTIGKNQPIPVNQPINSIHINQPKT